jgi:hypothetical protein
MNLPHLRPVKNKQDETTKFGRDINYLVETLTQPLEPGRHIYTVTLGTRDPEFKNGPDYLKAIKTALGEMSLEKCDVDLEASAEASLVPSTYGLNYGLTKYWPKSHNILVVTREVELATVIPLSLNEELRPIAA